MGYAAYVKIDGRYTRVLPRSRKASVFPTVDAAVRALEQRGERIKTGDPRGVITGPDGAIVCYTAI